MVSPVSIIQLRRSPLSCNIAIVQDDQIVWQLAALRLHLT